MFKAGRELSVHHSTPMRNEILPAISVDKGCHSHQPLQPPAYGDGDVVSPEGTQEGNKEHLPSSSHRAAATPHGEP